MDLCLTWPFLILDWVLLSFFFFLFKFYIRSTMTDSGEGFIWNSIEFIVSLSSWPAFTIMLIQFELQLAVTLCWSYSVKWTAARPSLLIWDWLTGPESAGMADFGLGVMVDLTGVLLESCCSSVVSSSSSCIVAWVLIVVLGQRCIKHYMLTRLRIWHCKLAR